LLRFRAQAQHALDRVLPLALVGEGIVAGRGFRRLVEAGDGKIEPPVWRDQQAIVQEFETGRDRSEELPAFALGARECAGGQYEATRVEAQRAIAEQGVDERAARRLEARVPGERVAVRGHPGSVGTETRFVARISRADAENEPVVDAPIAADGDAVGGKAGTGGVVAAVARSEARIAADPHARSARRSDRRRARVLHRDGGRGCRIEVPRFHPPLDIADLRAREAPRDLLLCADERDHVRVLRRIGPPSHGDGHLPPATTARPRRRRCS
jgi:hypothetical protein